MSWSRDDEATGRRGYHHGNLREALIRAALNLIAEKGPAGFTFADATRPFAFHTVVTDSITINSIWHRCQSDTFLVPNDETAAVMIRAGVPKERVRVLGFPVPPRFARAEPAYYSAMFEAGLPFEGDPDLREAADRAFAVLRRAADAFCARLPSDRRPPALMMSLHLWALAHGIASLFGRADGGRRKLPMSAEELLEAGVLVYLRGLSLIDNPKP